MENKEILEEQSMTEKNTDSVKQYTLSGTMIQKILLVILCLMSVQPFVGIATRLNTTNQLTLLADINNMFLTKSVIIRYVGYIAAIAAILISLLKENVSLVSFFKSLFYKKPWNICLMLLFIWTTISTFFISPILDISINGDAYRFEGTFSYLAYAGFFGAASLLLDVKYKKRWMQFNIGASVILGIATIYSHFAESPELLTYMERSIEAGLTATFPQYNHYAYYLSIMLVMTAGLYLTEKTRKVRILYLVLYAFQQYVLALNGTRGGYLATITGLIALSVILTIRKETDKKHIIIIWVTAVLATIPASSVFIERFTSIFGDLSGIIKQEEDRDSAGSGRWSLWKNSFALFVDKPLFGYGTNMAYYALSEFRGISDMPHNEYIQHLVDFGLVGITLYLGGLISLFVNCLKKIKVMPTVNVLLGCVAITYAASAFFGVTIVEVLPFFYIALGLVKWEKPVPQTEGFADATDTKTAETEEITAVAEETAVTTAEK